MTEQMRCGACHAANIDSSHSCIEAKYLLEIRNWLLEGIEDTGHELGHYFVSVQRNSRTLNKYAHAISIDMQSVARAEIHHDVCKILGADHNKFKPFESDDIHDLPTQEEALIILWEAVLDFMWEYTRVFRLKKKTYREAVALRDRYFPHVKTNKGN